MQKGNICLLLLYFPLKFCIISIFSDNQFTLPSMNFNQKPLSFYRFNLTYLKYVNLFTEPAKVTIVEPTHSMQASEEKTVKQRPDASANLGKNNVIDASKGMVDEKAEEESSTKEGVEHKEEPSPADSRSSEGTGSDFEIVSEQSIEQEISGGKGESNAVEVGEIEENEDEKSISSGNATPVREVVVKEVGEDKALEEERQLTKEGSAEKTASSLGQPDLEERLPPSEPASQASSQRQHSPLSSPPRKEERPRQASVTVDADSREPPPLFDDDDDDDDDNDQDR